MAETEAPTIRSWATQRRDQARREVEAWDEFLRLLDEYPNASSRPSVPDLAPRSAPSGPPTNVPMAAGAKPHRQPTEGRHKDPAVAATVEATKTFLATLGHPAGISAIYDEMLRLNIPVGGVSPKRTLDARLRYSGAFKGVAGKGWWLVDRPAPGQTETAKVGDPTERSSENAFRYVEPDRYVEPG